MKKVVKVFLIIAICLFAGLILLKSCGSSMSVKNRALIKNAVVRVENNQLCPINFPDIQSDIIVDNFENDVYYTLLTFDSGDQIQCKYFDDTDTFTIYLFTPSINVEDVADRLSIAIYDTSTQDLEYDSASNFIYNVINYTSNNNIIYSNYFGVDYLDLFQSTIDNRYNLTLNTWDIILNNYSVSQAYEDGKDEGIQEGILEVLNNPATYGLYTSSEYLNYGDVKYDQGQSNPGQQDFINSGLKNFFNTIILAPYNVMKGMFDFDFLGVNLFNLFSFLFTFAIVGYCIKKII